MTECIFCGSTDISASEVYEPDWKPYETDESWLIEYRCNVCWAEWGKVIEGENNEQTTK